MTQSATPVTQGCVFCAVAAGRAEASVVHEDETVVAFMDLNPVTQGHLLVVPRAHAVGLEDLDPATGAHVWSVGHGLARALRRSRLRCEGVNLLVCDGEVAFQTVFHVHLHVIPRYAGDGWTLVPDTTERDRSLLDADARAVRDAVAEVGARGPTPGAERAAHRTPGPSRPA
ncbi:HIT domain-containing protein [Cellulomonas sp. JZ18]|uniref:HIT family protein n=1 Tax=Cellulomonas sp. JZ18 TaxID=2654191 RepID=UPI0012D4B73B|nr:HIT family protein [Cellulomonas sp. JZ18]QGQ20520.1 HIT domain-containing protein [Cellulomonas sp. JZ18]